jgi:hypothetical protein
VQPRMGFLSLIGSVVLGGCALLTPAFGGSGDFTHVEADAIPASPGVVVGYELAGGTYEVAWDTACQGSSASWQANGSVALKLFDTKVDPMQGKRRIDLPAGTGHVGVSATCPPGTPFRVTLDAR